MTRLWVLSKEVEFERRKISSGENMIGCQPIEWDVVFVPSPREQIGKLESDAGEKRAMSRREGIAALKRGK